MGVYAECQQGVVALDKLESAAHAVLKHSFVGDQMVARGDYHACLGIACAYVADGPGNARSCVAAAWLKEYLAVGQFRKLLPDYGRVCGVGDHYDMSRIHQREYAVVAHLEQRAAGAKKVDKLFGHACAAVGPEPASDASAHYHAVSVVVGVHDCVLNMVIKWVFQKVYTAKLRKYFDISYPAGYD